MCIRDSINVKFLIINDKVQNHIVSVDDVSTFLNIIDPLIKGLPPKVFLKHIAHIGMASHDDILFSGSEISCNRHYFLVHFIYIY